MSVKLIFSNESKTLLEQANDKFVCY